MKYKIKFLSDTFLHPDLRWDGEYFCFEPYINKNLKYVPINDILSFSQYGLSISMNEEKKGTKIYRMNEINNMFCDRDISKYAKIDSNDIQPYKLKDKDVLFNRTNSFKFVGRSGIFRKFSNDEVVFASYLVRIRLKSEIVTPEYLTAFLNTKYGLADIKRRARISINQSNVNPKELKRVKIPLLPILQKKVTVLFDKAFKILEDSELKYKQAQNVLLSELGLTGWKPKQELTFIKHYSDVERAGRMDAEYFQPKYEDIINKIKNYKGGWDTLENLVSLKDDNFKPEKELSYKYIELSHISGNGKITDCITQKGHNLPSRAKRLVSTGDVIVSSVEGSLSKIALIGQEYDQAICSNGFHVIKSNRLNSETILLLMKSIFGQWQLQKGCGGMILTAINKKELYKIILPVIDTNTQNQIHQKIFQSLSLYKKSRALLQFSKYAVQKAIETDEKTALAWLDNKLKHHT